jgi:hypothetical protein
MLHSAVRPQKGDVAADAEPAFGSYPSHVFGESYGFADSLPESAKVLHSYSQESGRRVIERFPGPSEIKISPLFGPR